MSSENDNIESEQHLRNRRQNLPSSASVGGGGEENSKTTNINGQTFTTATTRLNYGSADAYTQACRQYLASYNAWNQFCCAKYVSELQRQGQQQNVALFAGNNLNQNQSNNNNINVATNIVNNNNNVAQPAPHANITLNRIFTPSSFVHRLAAEGIDCCFCFMLKLLIVFLMVEMQLMFVTIFNISFCLVFPYYNYLIYHMKRALNKNNKSKRQLSSII